MRFSCQGRSRDSGAKQPLQGNSMSVKSAKQISQKYRFYICPIRTATETENQIGMWQLVLDNTRPMPDFHVKNHIYDLLSSIIKGFPALILCAKCWKPSSTSGCCSYFEIQRYSCLRLLSAVKAVHSNSLLRCRVRFPSLMTYRIDIKNDRIGKVTVFHKGFALE